MRHVALALVALLFSGCGSDAAPPSEDAAASDAHEPTSQSSLILITDEVRNPGPARLRPGDQLVRNDQGYDLYTALWTKPHFGPGNSTHPRAVSLNMTISNDGPAFSIKAYFVSESGREGPLTRTSRCRGTGKIPLTIPHGSEADGCLSYYIPADAGRLILTGGADFGYYVTIPATVP